MVGTSFPEFVPSRGFIRAKITATCCCFVAANWTYYVYCINVVHARTNVRINCTNDNEKFKYNEMHNFVTKDRTTLFFLLKMILRDHQDTYLLKIVRKIQTRVRAWTDFFLWMTFKVARFSSRQFSSRDRNISSSVILMWSKFDHTNETNRSYNDLSGLILRDKDIVKIQTCV